jgi:hypothetical protein
MYFKPDPTAAPDWETLPTSGIQSPDPTISNLFGTAGTYQPQSFGKTLADYLAAAGDGSNLIAAQLDALSQERAGGRQQADTGEKNIGDIYAGLQSQITQAGTDTATRYKQAQTDTQAAQNAAAAAIQSAAKSSGGDVNKTLANLGISDSAKQAKQTGAEYTTQGVANGASSTAAAIQNLIGTSNNQQNFLTGSANAAGLEGAQQQSNLEDQLQAYLSSLSTQEDTLRDNAAQTAQQNATNEYNADYSAFNNTQQQKEQSSQDAWNQAVQMYGLQSDAAAAQNQTSSSSEDTPTTGVQGAEYILANSGLASQDQQSIMSSIYSGLSQPTAIGKDGKAVQQSPYQRAYASVMQLPPNLQGAALNALTAMTSGSGANF